ncbi:MAG: hypothetical protein AB7N76_26655 [Planctomycetota bacterium]
MVFQVVQDEAGRKYELVPVSISSGQVLKAGVSVNSVTFDFAAHPGTACERLYDLAESAVLLRALGHSLPRDYILSWLGLDPQASWCVLGLLRQHLSRELPLGKPGDFDLIGGRVVDGVPSFDYLVELEVKRRTVRDDGAPDNMSENGTKQAEGAAALGFDRVLLLHLLVGAERDLPDGCADSWASVHNGDFAQAVKMTAGRLRSILDSDRAPRFGYGLLGWGQVKDTDPSLTSAVCPVLLRPPPELRCHGPMGPSRERMIAGLKSFFSRPGVDPRHRFFFICQRCHEASVVPQQAGRGAQIACARCGERC